VVEADAPLRVVRARAPTVERQDGGGEEESGQGGEGFHVGLVAVEVMGRRLELRLEQAGE
jgi:hypothetical protein